MNIIVLYGGNSPEREVSKSSGETVKKYLEKNGHQIVLLDLSRNYSLYQNVETFDQLYVKQSEDHLFRQTDQTKEVGDCVSECCRLADFVFLATHGGIGENGKLQALLEIEKIPFSGNGFLSTAISMDKDLAKKIVQSDELHVPKTFKNLHVLTEEDYPVVLKPNDGGSSLGVQIVNNPSERDILLENEKITKGNIMIEQLVKGREFSVGVVGERVLPPIEIKITEGFFDYEKKYTEYAVEEVVPAAIDRSLSEKMCRLAKEVHQLFGFEVYSRADFIVDTDGEIYFIESNSIPGMTPNSLITKEAQAVGMSFAGLCEKIIELSIRERGTWSE